MAYKFVWGFGKDKKKTERINTNFPLAKPLRTQPHKRFQPNKQSKRENFKLNERKAPKANNGEKFSLRVFLDSIFDFKFNHDKRLFYTFLLLLFIGIVAVYSSSIIFAYKFTGDEFYFLKNHLKFIVMGTVFFFIFYFIRPEIFVKLWYIPLFASIILLILTLVLTELGQNESVDGATRWIQLGSISFQPSDFAKLSFVIFIAAFLSNKKSHYLDFGEYLVQNFIPFSIWLFLIIALILAGKNLGTAMVVGFIGIATYSVSSVTKFHKYGLMILLGVMFIGGVIFIKVESYRSQRRFDVWTNYLRTGDTIIEEANGVKSRTDRSFQFDQVLTACGTGGSTGVGLGKSSSKFYFAKTTAGDDSIICIIGEELGFYVTTVILLIYLYLIYTCISVAYKFVEKPIYFYLMIATSSWIGIQMFVHVAANVGVIPLTGQTLPFISLGGSSLIALMCAMGLILNVSKQEHAVNQQNNFEKSEFKRNIKL